MSDVPHDLFKAQLHTYTVKSATAAKRYLNDRHVLHIHFFAGVSGPTRVGNYFRLASQVALVNDDFAKSKIPFIPKHAADILHGPREQQAMLVDIRELMEHPERVSCEFIPHVVRLQSLNDCLRCWINTANFSEKVIGIMLLNVNNPLPEFIAE